MSDPFGFDPNMFSQVPLFRELARVLSWRGGPVNWDLARQTAASVTAAGPGRRALPAGDRAEGEFAQAVIAAELWLDGVTELPAVEGPARVLGADEWVGLASTSDGLGLYVEPVAAGMSDALTQSLPEELRGMLPGLGGAGGEQALAGVFGPMGAMLYGVQVGTVAGHLAGQLLGSYDLGVPTVEPRTVATVGSVAAEFAREHGFDETELRYWVALREAAHRRQFAGVPWLRGHLADLVRAFAAGADPDPAGLLEQLGGMGDPTALADPERLRGVLENPDAFRVEPTAAQREVLARLQTLVAFTSSWVDTVVSAAAGDKLPSLDRFTEALRRRRGEAGAGERYLAQLLGLDLRPADARAGAAFCEAVLVARGQAGLDRAWRGPEYLPAPDELAEPSRWLVRLAADEQPVDLPSLEDLPPIPDDLTELDESE